MITTEAEKAGMQLGMQIAVISSKCLSWVVAFLVWLVLLNSGVLICRFVETDSKANANPFWREIFRFVNRC